MADNKNTFQAGRSVAKTARGNATSGDAPKGNKVNFAKSGTIKARPSTKKPALVAAATQPVQPAKTLRPIGLAEGEFVVPADFNDPLPEDLLVAFNGL